MPETIPGTLVFVDISGFTAMSEKLAKFGRVGAEEMTDVLNSVFSELLSIAYQAGGDLIKFGGDALLLLFDGQDHALRAVSSCIHMRHRLKTVGRVTTTGGITQLRMSIGVNSGDFHFILAGDIHRELLILGSDATDTVLMESVAEAGEILVGGSTADLLPSRFVGKPKGEGKLVRRITVPLISQPTKTSVPKDPAEFMFPAIRDYLAQNTPTGEHRSVAIAFIQFSNVDKQLATYPKETVWHLHQMIAATQTVCLKNGITFLGTDISKDGGKMILVGGAPTSLGDNEERLLQTARVILDSNDTPFSLRIGLNLGPVFMGDVGASFRRTYTMLGDAVNLAARLMAKAEDGQLVVAPQIVNRSSTQYATEPLTPFRVKGKVKPVQALLVGKLEFIGKTSHAKTRFVGRHQELEVLRSAWRDEAGAAVHVVGETGLGKTRLIEEAFSDERSYVSLCAPYASSSPYFPFRWLLRQLLGIPSDADASSAGDLLVRAVARLAPQLIPWIPLIAIPVDAKVNETKEVSQLAENFALDKMHQVTAELLAGIATEKLIIVIEDTHWIDDASSKLVAHLQAHASENPWLLITSSRALTGPPSPPNTLFLELPPLDEHDSRSVIEDAAGEPLLPEESKLLIERAGGNPLFLEEISRVRSVDKLPDSIETLMAARIDRLKPQDRNLLREASVVGMIFNSELLPSRHEDAANTSASVNMRLNEFVEQLDDTRFRFKHALLRDVAYEGLPFSKRRSLHLLVGHHIEASTDDIESWSEVLSLHFFRASEFHKAWKYSLIAGRRSKEKYANSEALTYFTRAIESSRKIEVDELTLSRVWSDLAYVAKTGGRLADSRRAYRMARRLQSSSPTAVADLYFREGEIMERSGKFTQALTLYKKGLNSLPQAIDPQAGKTRVRLLVATAFTRFRQGKFTECVRVAEQALSEADTFGDRPGAAHSSALLHLAFLSMGDPRRADYRHLALPIYEEIGDLEGQGRVLNNLGFEAYSDGRWKEAVELFEKASSVHSKTGDVVGSVEVSVNLGEIYSDAGQLELAIRFLMNALKLARASSYRLAEAVALSDLGRAYIRAGNLEKANSHLSEAIQLFEELSAKDFALEAKIRQTEIHLARDEVDDAIRLANECVVEVSSTGANRLEPEAKRVLGLSLISVDRVAAESELRAAVEAARSVGNLFQEALALDSLADLLGDRSMADQSSRLCAQLGIEEIRASSSRQS